MSGLRLVAENLWKYYNDKPVVQDVSFTLEPGEIVGLLGQNGAGKTTIVGMLYGAVVRSKGASRLEPGGIATDSSEARKSIGIVTQDDNLDPDFNVRDNLILFAHHYRITGSAAQKRADQLIETLGLEEFRTHRVDDLSGGFQRRVVLARALIPDPNIIFLDEPTTGFDPDVRQEFWKLILKLRAEGKSILLTTHYMDEAERLCDRIVLLQRGIKIDEGSPEQLIQRIIGREIVEVEGVSQEILRNIIPDQNTPILSFGTVFLVPQQVLSDSVLTQLQDAASPILRTRKANLEDVFLTLTKTENREGNL